MSIQIICGGAGSGKSHYLANLIIQESVEHPERNYLVIVPEQATLQTQLKYVALHPRKGLINIDVLSFERLAHRVLSETGEGEHTLITDTGVSLILRSLAMDLTERMPVFGRNFKKTGYVNEMKSLLIEMSQYLVEGETLDEAIRMCSDNKLLRDKLLDIRVLQRAWQEYMHGTADTETGTAGSSEESTVAGVNVTSPENMSDWTDLNTDRSSSNVRNGRQMMTGEELLEKLGRNAARSGILKDAILCFDGFTGFTPAQTELLKDLMKVCGQVYITATLDEDRSPFADRGDRDLFHISTEMTGDVIAIGRELGRKIYEPIRVDNEDKYKSADMITLGRNLFRYDRQKSKTEPARDILIHQVRNPREEVALAASLVDKYVRAGLRYREIGIIAGSMETYAPYWDRAFAERKIPYFLDMKRSAMGNVCVEFVRSAIKLIEDRFSYDSMFRFLKTGLCEIREEDLYLLENYCLAMGIRGYKKWHEPWTRPMRRMEEAELIRVDHIRSEICSKLETYEMAMRKGPKNLSHRVKALYGLCLDFHIEEQIQVRGAELGLNGRKDLEEEYSQIYGLIMKLMDQMVSLLGDEKVSPTEFSEIMDAGLGEIRVGVIPPGNDQVLIGDMERSRMGQIKVLIVTGFNDGMLPKISSDTSILTDNDRMYLQKKGIRLSPTTAQKSFVQRFYLYMNLGHATDKLHICYSNADMSGAALRPSYYLWEIRRIFPDIKVIDEVATEGMRDVSSSGEAAMRYMAEHACDYYEDDIWKQLYSYYYDDPLYRNRIELIRQGAYRGETGETLSRQTADELYGDRIRTSITRLETYAACPYSYFLKYVLALEPRDIFGFEVLDLGNFFHEALYGYGRLLRERKLSWTEVSDELGRELRGKAVDMAINSQTTDALTSTAELTWYGRRLRKLFDTTIWAMTRQLEAGDYAPAEYEMEFGKGDRSGITVETDPEHVLELTGKIDRLDLAGTSNRTYVRIMDYKTGSKTCDLSAIYEGLDLQLFTYLEAAMEEVRRRNPGKLTEPGGVMYYHIDDPMSSTEDTMELLKELRPDGIVNSSNDSLAMMDRGFAEDGYKESPYIRTRKTDKGFYKGSKILSSEEFELMGRHLQNKIAETGGKILSGNIEVSPVSGLKDGCEYCDYNQICGFDKSRPGCHSRYVGKREVEEIVAELNENTGGNNV